ncbi:MAG: bifunctional 4-hydroxy-2-oxoglutarate aldolase/2-dehydro-3-deoxy-phosphogluconate aldolase [Spirochaetia bacterium]|jgi:2-dehydro-3-deoxyphosphogluconate aldolase/(4S)-4-hydroxy-2-oxoglutarate aldolase|nr:bifunctional 4-hydroxy-2-oxoglutarate aldolase/2-dehydro-3-deoxy-phosphogluconate aldolase [Spirochaetia bacterium]
MFEDFYQKVHEIGIIPVVKIDDAADAEALAGALIKGGIPAAEVTFRTAAAEEAIRRICKAYPEMLVGAGTVLSVENAAKAIAAGARFIVSPGYDETLVSWCLGKGIPICPGVCTPSDIQKGIAAGLSVLKFFPAEASGGVNMLKNLGGPFPSLKFMPTGGIGLQNVTDYAKAPNVLCVGGSWMVKSDLISSGNWEEITKKSKDAELALQGFSLVHVGINNADEQLASKAAKSFEAFGMVQKIGKSSTFMDDKIELMHTSFYGANGHLGFSCIDVDRSIHYLAQFGFTPRQESIRKDGKGATTVAYLEQEIAGFAIHLVRK